LQGGPGGGPSFGRGSGGYDAPINPNIPS